MKENLQAGSAGIPAGRSAKFSPTHLPNPRPRGNWPPGHCNQCAHPARLRRTCRQGCRRSQLARFFWL